MGLKASVHLVFCLCAARRLHFQVRRDEKAVPWLAGAALGCVSEHTQVALRWACRRNSSSVTSLIRSSIEGPGVQGFSHAVTPNPEEFVSPSF